MNPSKIDSTSNSSSSPILSRNKTLIQNNTEILKNLNNEEISLLDFNNLSINNSLNDFSYGTTFVKFLSYNYYRGKNYFKNYR